VVLLVGPDYQARQREAEVLLAVGLARYLIISAHGTVVDQGTVGVAEALLAPLPRLGT
jgi:hypothetical protein